MNQTTVIGPKKKATLAVPRDCAANSAIKMRMASGSTKSPNAGETSFKPSTAERTEMAGVMTASP